MAALSAPAAGAMAALREAIAALPRAFEGFALPQRCPGCGAEADPAWLLCAACHAAIPRLSYALCVHCLARGREPVGCTRHAGHLVWPAWVYDERAARVVHAFKFAERPALAAALARDLAAALPPGLAPDLVIGVPLHPARRRERGYDQAALLADQLARVIGAPRLEGALARVRSTPPQSRLGSGARRRNLAGAFRVVRASAVAGRRVLLVDDVVTTGATLEAGLDALAAAGAEPVAAALAWAQ